VLEAGWNGSAAKGGRMAKNAVNLITTAVHYNRPTTISPSMDTILVKTAQGRAEMNARSLGLLMLERRLLIMADGKRTLAQMQPVFNVSVVDLAEKLQSLGLLEPGASSAKYLPSDAAVAAAFPELLPFDEPTIGVDVELDAALAEDLASDFAEELTSEFRSEAETSSLGSENEGDTQPGLLTHRAASPYGLVAAKAYLVEKIQTMLGADGVWLIRKIAAVKTEADLYYTLEMFVTSISVYTSASSVNGIIRGFEEKISQR
jgi:hypothetical protein